MERGIVAKQHNELFRAKSWDITSLQHKFNSIANMTSPTGDPNILGYVLVGKDVMQAIEIKMESEDVAQGDLGIADFEYEARTEDRSNLLDESRRTRRSYNMIFRNTAISTPA
jgi:hypothetical protein